MQCVKAHCMLGLHFVGFVYQFGWKVKPARDLVRCNHEVEAVFLLGDVTQKEIYRISTNLELLNRIPFLSTIYLFGLGDNGSNN